MWSRNFTLFFAARGVTRLGDVMAPVAMAAGLVLNGHGAGAVGAAMASMTATFAGFVVFGGVIADRFSPRSLMIGSDLVRVVSTGLIAALFFSGHVVLWQLCVLSAVNGTCAALFQPGIAGTIPRIARDVQSANGAIRTVESVMNLAGPAVAGALVGLTEAGGVFVVHATTYLLSALCLMAMRLAPPNGREVRGGTFRSDLVEGWREFRSRTWLWAVIVVWMVFMIASWGPSVPLIATKLVTEHGAGAFGWINSAAGGGMAVGGLLAMRLRPVRPLRAGAIALLGRCLGVGSIVAGLPAGWIAAAMAVDGACMAFWGVMWTTSILTQVPREVVARVHAYDVAGSIAMMPVGQALAGPAAAAFGATHVLAVNAVVALAAPIALLAVPAIRNLRRAEAT
ncbi:MFS transporter [Streptomyces sp. NPDC051940]|uniref:MFS transporter n=1 Tax=Streptomyces sp. NPDC051940 TaxID=3155675 RepID=UPI00342BB38C